MTRVLPTTGRESRILRRARPVIAPFAAHPGVATVSAAGWARPAGLIRLCDETRQTLDADHGVTDGVRARFEAAPAGPTAAGRSADERHQHLARVLAHHDSVDLVAVACLREMVAERA